MYIYYVSCWEAMVSDIIREIKNNFEKLPEWEKEYLKQKIG